MTFRPDTSFPYLAIARRFGVPYGQVLAMCDQFDDPSRLVTIDHWDWRTFLQRNAVFAAWRAEKRRRAAVIEEMNRSAPLRLPLTTQAAAP